MTSPCRFIQPSVPLLFFRTPLPDQFLRYQLLERQAEPVGVFLRISGNIFLEGIKPYPLEIISLLEIECRVSIIMPNENVQILVFGQAIRKIDFINKFEHLFELAIKSISSSRRL